MQKLSFTLSFIALSFISSITYAQTYPQSGSSVDGAYSAKYTKDCAIFDVLSSGETLEKINFENQLWIEGQNQKEYSLRITNICDSRVLAVVSVDGLNVLNGQKASYNQGGYLVEPGNSVVVPGWGVSDPQNSAFSFTYPIDYYAERVNKVKNAGIIEVAFFNEEYSPPSSRSMEQETNLSDSDTPFSVTGARYETRNKLVQIGAIPFYPSSP